MKRTQSLLVVALIALLLASGCVVPTAPAPAPEATEAPEEPAAEEPVELQFFTWAEDDFEQSSLEQLVESFFRTEGIPVNLDVVR